MKYRVKHCEVCGVRRRWNYQSSVNTDGLHITEIWACSKGHRHNIYRGTSLLLNKILKWTYLPAMAEMFNRESPLMAYLKR